MYYHLIRNIYQIRNFRRRIRTATSLSEVEELIQQTTAIHQSSPEQAMQFARTWFYLPKLNKNLDPSSNEYLEIQKKNYETFSGQKWGAFDVVAQDERIAFDSIAGLYPYATKNNNLVGNHLQRTGYWMSQMKLSPSDRIIEFGAGSAELATFMSLSGFNVLATDISETYVDVIRRKSALLNIPLQTKRLDMARFQSSERFDVAIFCESFHHSSDFLALLKNLEKIIAPGGRVYLCGEPITYYPYPWGVRTDGESIWMARRFGWLELGFDQFYFKKLVSSLGWDFNLNSNKSIDHAASVICLTRNV
jgi:2-polyprenyl-3-methyl-5-hydroxy-6-metoxy-1,4-benzoquinol methylase